MAQQVPASIEAEQALLGSLLLYPQTADLVYEEGIEPEDFFSDKNRRIYREIQQLYREKKPIDVTTLITRLTDKQQISAVGGAEYFSYLTDVAISSTNSEYYISIIKDKSLLRQMIEVTENIRMKCMEEQYDPMSVLNEAESQISKISQSRRTSDFTSSKTTFDDVIKRLNEVAQSGVMTGVPSGYDHLDNITNGFQKGNLIILAARPAVGKTALALNIAANAACTNRTVALFSLEMPYIDLGNRMLSAKSTVDSQKIRTGRYLTNDDWARVDEAKSIMEKTALFIDDSTGIKVNDIMAKCRKLQSEHGLDLVIIDYLQLIDAANSRSDNRAQEVSEISRALKQMARELNVPVIALSQLSRKSEESNREPILSDLRESGAIEQDADIVMFIHRKKKENEQEEENSEIADLKIIIAKHRNGPIGNVWLAFDKKTNAFYTKEYRDDEYE
ncbi:MAG: replicative DNA helicase [Erysipelotrichaceae bacterium]|nr:replicative DNA helicase [Erysipelotrichaceae bacterium]